MRPQLLVVTHVLSVIGLSILAVGLVLGLTLIGSIVFPGSPPWLAGSSAVVILVFWIVVPWLTRRAGGR